MNNKIFVGNLAFSISEGQLKEIFEEVGGVLSVKLVTDRDTGRPRGFGFVEMENPEDVSKAIETLDGREIEGRKIGVSEAKPQRDKRPDGRRNNTNRW